VTPTPQSLGEFLGGNFGGFSGSSGFLQQARPAQSHSGLVGRSGDNIKIILAKSIWLAAFNDQHPDDLLANL
jgi:hypothetical protein